MLLWFYFIVINSIITLLTVASYKMCNSNMLICATWLSLSNFLVFWFFSLHFNSFLFQYPIFCLQRNSSLLIHFKLITCTLVKCPKWLLNFARWHDFIERYIYGVYTERSSCTHWVHGSIASQIQWKVQNLVNVKRFFLFNNLQFLFSCSFQIRFCFQTWKKKAKIHFTKAIYYSD